LLHKTGLGQTLQGLADRGAGDVKPLGELDFIQPLAIFEGAVKISPLKFVGNDVSSAFVPCLMS
jgi:hypothetical protein